MESKELKVQIPEGFEIDKENSTFECIKFKSIKKDIPYEKVCENIFDEKGYYINSWGNIKFNDLGLGKADKGNATNEKQLEKILALNQLFNIAEYYNRLNPFTDIYYHILYNKKIAKYEVCAISQFYSFGVEPVFNNKEDAHAVIANPNFRGILDTVYKS